MLENGSLRQRTQEKVPEAGILFIVPTPIGNLSDITLRALETLKFVDEIYAEDTRETGKLLNYYGIKKKIFTYLGGYEKKSEEILRKLKEGKKIAIVSDRGTPCINDPGYEIVEQALKSGIKVVPLPGPNAAITALEASGFPADEFVYLGFLPKKGRQRKLTFEMIKETGKTTVFYESPKRIVKTLEEIIEVVGKETECFLAREITKMHEELLKGKLEEILDELKNRKSISGEIVVVLYPESTQPKDFLKAEKLVKMLLKQRVPLKKAVKTAADFFNLKPKELYEKFISKD